MLYLRSILKAYFKSAIFKAFLATLATFVIFDLLWCAQTTFRAMSNPALYANMLLVSSLLTLPFCLLPKRWLHSIILLIVATHMAALLMYANTYYQAIPLRSYTIAGNLTDFIPSLVHSFSPLYLLLYLPFVAFLIIRLKSRTSNRRHRRSESTAGYLLVTLIFGVIAAIVMLCQGGFKHAYVKLKNACYYSTTTTPTFAVYGDIIYELIATPTSPAQQKAEIQKVREWLDFHNSHFPLQSLDSIREVKSVVMIICESLESWPIGKSVEGQELTPYLNSLIKDSTTLFVPHVVTQVGSGRSIDCQLLVNSGLLPMEKDVYSFFFSSSTYPSLIKAHRQKYPTARSILMTCDKPITWNQQAIATSFGIDTLLSKSDWKNDELVGNPPKLSDGALLSQAVNKLKSNDLWPVGDPRFLQIITYSGHFPFIIPEKLRSVHFTDTVPEMLANYMTAVNYTDRSLKTMVDYLRTRPDFDSTMIVIVGDHEGLAKWRAELTSSPVGKGLVDDKQFTPFIVVNSPVGGSYEDVIMGQVDLYPTLLNLAGLEGYNWHGVGHSLFAADRPQYAIVTMTKEIVGDTTRILPEIKRHTASAQEISDRIIRFDALKTQDTEKQ